MNKTSIEWADYVWNPVTGCTKVSEGCRNCYAEAMAKRFWGERKFTDVMCHPERLDQPMKVKKGGRVFVNSMSDLFHPDVPSEFIGQVFEAMGQARQHTFIILTKRPEIMAQETRVISVAGTVHYPLPNVWLGVSVEDQRSLHDRYIWMQDIPAVVRFISVEPMLGPVDFRGFIDDLDWVICGAESGPRRRPMHMDWARWLRDQCMAAGVPFFLKQMQVDGKMTSMPELDGRVWNQYPGVVR
jgi:protein gp37